MNRPPLVCLQIRTLQVPFLFHLVAFSLGTSDELMGNDKEVSFEVSTTAEFRFMRFSMFGRNSSGDLLFSLQRLELYGLLLPIQKN
jgi:hypothetical protein